MKRMPEKTQILVARLILCGFVSGALYIFMHELGHGIVAVAAGVRVTRFSLIRGFVARMGIVLNVGLQNKIQVPVRRQEERFPGRQHGGF